MSQNDSFITGYWRTRTPFYLVVLGAGNLINWLLHGILTVQLYLYYLAFPNDKTWTKTVIYTVYFLETVQVIGLGTIFLMMLSGGSISDSASTFTFSFNPMPLGYPYENSAWPTQALLIDVIGGLVPLIAQCIYAHRIWIITQRKIMPWLITGLAILQLFVAILTGTGVFPIVNVALFWTGLNMVNDSIIAFIMVRSLSKEKPLSNNTKSKVVRLVRLIIATGSLTGMPKLYANSMLVMLNNRMTIRKSRDMKTDVVSTLVIASNLNGPSDSATSQVDTGEVSTV